MENSVKLKIGQIEFEASGTIELIERERGIFLNDILPVAVNAIVNTCVVEQAPKFISETEGVPLLIEESHKESDFSSIDANEITEESLAAYIRKFGSINEQDFALMSAYYFEHKNGSNTFTSDDVKRYYEEARRTKPANISQSLTGLVKKGLIMDAPNTDKVTPKPYILTSEGIDYINSYEPKETTLKKPSKPKKTRTKTESIYSNLILDNLNLQNYPEIKNLKSFKDKMILVMFIITQANSGEWFSSNDIMFLMKDKFGESATNDQINGVFKREKTWFNIDNSEPKNVRRKLLNGGNDHARLLISNQNEN